MTISAINKVEEAHYPDPATVKNGTVGARTFEPLESGDTKRAANSTRPTPPERRSLKLVSSQRATPTAARLIQTTHATDATHKAYLSPSSLASTPDSGFPPSASMLTLHISEPGSPGVDDPGINARSFSSSDSAPPPRNTPIAHPDSLNPFEDTDFVDTQSLQSEDGDASPPVPSPRTRPASNGAEPKKAVTPEGASPGAASTGAASTGAAPFGTSTTANTSTTATTSNTGAASTTSPKSPTSSPTSTTSSTSTTPTGSITSALSTAFTTPRTVLPTSAQVITAPEQHPDVRVTIEALRETMARDSAYSADPSRKIGKNLSAAPLRRIARAQRDMSDGLHHRALAFYKAVTALSAQPDSVPAQKQAALMLAALSQQAMTNGYEALDQDLVKRVLMRLLHSLPFEQLCALARLNDRGDGVGDAVLYRAGQLLGADKAARTIRGDQAAQQYEVASRILGVVAELSREQARAASWDRQVAAALETARNGQHQQLDAVLRDMWQGDLLTGETDRPRIRRLMDLINRLGANQRNGLATMLGVAAAPDASTKAFADFQARHLVEFESDPVIARQMLGFIDDLRRASALTLNIHGAVPASGSRDAALPPDAAAPLRRPASFKDTLDRLRRSLRSTLLRRPSTRDAARTHIKQTLHALIEGDRLTAVQYQALQSITDKLSGKLSDSNKASAYLRGLIQDELSKLDAGQLEQLRINMASARQSATSAAHEPAIESFYAVLEERLGKEADIRRGARALKEVLAALPQSGRPERLLDALDLLADAQAAVLSPQSEADFYAEALARVGDKARATLQKHLKRREDVHRHMRGVQAELSYAPAVWLHYRHSQLELLFRVAHATA